MTKTSGILERGSNAGRRPFREFVVALRERRREFLQPAQSESAVCLSVLCAELSDVRLRRETHGDSPSYVTVIRLVKVQEPKRRRAPARQRAPRRGCVAARQ